MSMWWTQASLLAEDLPSLSKASPDPSAGQLGMLLWGEIVSDKLRDGEETF